MSGKNVIIFGDSYSTFEGYIPEGYAVYYSSHDDRHPTDVRRVEETWWHRVIEQTGDVLVRNNTKVLPARLAFAFSCFAAITSSGRSLSSSAMRSGFLK